VGPQIFPHMRTRTPSQDCTISRNGFDVWLVRQVPAAQGRETAAPTKNRTWILWVAKAMVYLCLFVCIVVAVVFFVEEDFSGHIHGERVPWSTGYTKYLNLAPHDDCNSIYGSRREHIACSMVDKKRGIVPQDLLFLEEPCNPRLAEQRNTAKGFS